MMKNVSKIALTAGTAIPLMYGLAMLAYDFDAGPDLLLARLYVPVLGIAAVTWLGFIAHVIRNPSLEKGTKALWIALLAVGTIFAELAYLAIHVFGRRSAQMTAPS